MGVARAPLELSLVRLELVALRPQLLFEFPPRCLRLLLSMRELLLVVALRVRSAVALLLDGVLHLCRRDFELAQLDIALANHRLEGRKRPVVPLELGVSLLEELQVVLEVLLQLGEALLVVRDLTVLFREQRVQR